MTTVYQLGPAEDAPVLVLEPSGVYEHLITRAIGPDETIAGDLVLKEGRKRYRPVNFPMAAAGFLVADEAGRAVLEPLLDECGHWVAIRLREKTSTSYSGFVCTRKIPALAEESELTRLSSGAIMTVRRLQLHEQLIRGVAAFVLSEWPRGPVYFSSDVIDAIAAAKLTGVVWSVAWSDDPNRPAVDRRLVSW